MFGENNNLLPPPHQMTKGPNNCFKTPVQTIKVLTRNYALMWDLTRKATTLKEGGEPHGIVQVLSEDSTYKSIIVNDKVTY